MFSEIMLVLKFLWSRLHIWIEHFTSCCHFCTFFNYYCIMNCIMCTLTPCKYTMIFTKSTWNSYVENKEDPEIPDRREPEVKRVIPEKKATEVSVGHRASRA